MYISKYGSFISVFSGDRQDRSRAAVDEGDEVGRLRVAAREAHGRALSVTNKE